MRNIDQSQIISEVKGLLFNCREVPRGQLLPESLEKLLSGYEPPLAQRHSNLLNIRPMVDRQQHKKPLAESAYSSAVDLRAYRGDAASQGDFNSFLEANSYLGREKQNRSTNTIGSGHKR